MFIQNSHSMPNMRRQTRTTNWESHKDIERYLPKEGKRLPLMSFFALETYCHSGLLQKVDSRSWRTGLLSFEGCLLGELVLSPTLGTYGFLYNLVQRN